MKGVTFALTVVSLLSFGCSGWTVGEPEPPRPLDPGSPGSSLDDGGAGGYDEIESEAWGGIWGGGGGGSTSGAPGGATGGGATASGHAAPTGDPCLTLTPTIRGNDGPNRLIGTDGPDVIFGGPGDDEIWGNGGNDVICAGGGEDRIEGGAGSDYIDAGFGRDVANGGAGSDLLHGRSGGDLLRGGPGNDILFGDLLDDELFGDDGHDILIGGHGIDVMHGGEGDDWLRGDTNRDEFTGGRGTDTVSFMTALPPGQSLGAMPAAAGVVVDNRDLTRGRASGDGYQETLVGVERIVGSAFDDHILSGAGTAAIAGSYGTDAIEAAAGTAVDEGPAPGEFAGGALVFVTSDRADVGLVAIGTGGDDHLSISVDGGIAVVRSENGAALSPGTGCATGSAATEVECVLVAELRFVVAYGGPGSDRFQLSGDGFPRDLTSTLDGGEGDDLLVGHSGQDILFAGPNGNDSMTGLEGDDALISESTDADVMSAGGGNDQLVANHPCAGHVFEGGGGIDVGGFARVGTHFDTAAERHRQRIHAHIGYRAYQPAFCAQAEGTELGGDIEILEGAGGDDELIGTDGNDTIWGWGGDDVIRGLGGNDLLEGHAGNDEIYGGAGRDRIRGGDGFDTIHAADGERDELSCGAGSGTTASRDPVDDGDC